LKILTIHNKYKIRGGEDESREGEDHLLAKNGHEIKELIFDNSVITPSNQWRVGLGTPWNRSSYRLVQAEIRKWKPDLVDIHNFFPLASPSVHWAARSLGIPVVQTLHNYRLLCPGATFYRDGRICEDCLEWKLPIPSIIHGCYRGSKVKTAAVALMVGTHRIARTWQRKVSAFVAVSEFEKRKFVESGFPESRIFVKSNFVQDSGLPGDGGGDFLCVSRLTVEKGIRTLIRAMDLTVAQVRLMIVGTGPLESEVQAATDQNPRIQYLGILPQREVLRLMGAAKCVIFPSEWYETFGRVAIEAFSRGTPVIAAQLGAIAELVEDGRTGFHFQPGNAQDLARAIDLAHASTSQLISMRLEARREFELKYTSERNYEKMMAIYERAIANP
jgi:glycosyltransferase involved in cell wall biosynthesis